MSGVNKVILIGHLGANPEFFNRDEAPLARLSIATSKKWKDKYGEVKQKTEWHRVVLWGRRAEVARDYLSKGSQVWIEGELETHKYVDKDGVERYSTQIIAHALSMCSPQQENCKKKKEQDNSDAQDYAEMSGASSAKRRQTTEYDDL